MPQEQRRRIRTFGEMERYRLGGRINCGCSSCEEHRRRHNIPTMAERIDRYGEAYPSRARIAEVDGLTDSSEGSTPSESEGTLWSGEFVAQDSPYRWTEATFGLQPVGPPPSLTDDSEEEEEELRECDWCGDQVTRRPGEAYVVASGEEICGACYDLDSITCNDCRLRHHIDNVHMDAFDRVICDSCYDRFWTRCQECERLILEGDTVDGCCPGCNEERRRVLRRYDYRPRPRFLDTPVSRTDKLYLGVELEVLGNEEVLSSNVETWGERGAGILYLKHDGSLDCGGEIVSHPATLDYHKSEFPWEEILRRLRRDGFKSHIGGQCGLHVHVSKNLLSLSDQAKLPIFVYSHTNAFAEIARRSSCGFARNKAVKNSEGNLDPGVIWAKKGQTRPLGLWEKYEAVNLTPAQTIEFRLWRGTLKYESFMACVEASHALPRFVQTASTPFLMKPKGWQAFVSFVQSERRTKYPYLFSLMQEKGLV